MPAPTKGPSGPQTTEGLSTWVSSDKPTREGVNYSLEEVNTALENKMPLSGGTITDGVVIDKQNQAGAGLTIKDAQGPDIRLENLGGGTPNVAQIAQQYNHILSIFEFLDNANQAGLYWSHDYASPAWQQVINGVSSAYVMLHSGNISNYALPRTGGTITRTVN